MLAEALDKLQQMAAKAAAARVIPVPNDPLAYYIVDGEGDLVEEHVGRKPFARKALDLETVVTFVAAHGGGELWAGRTGVVGIVGLSEDRDRVTFALSDSPPLAQLATWAKAGRGEVAQAEFVLMLRTLFDGCLDAHPTLKDDVKKVDFHKAQEATGTVQRANVSMSRKLVAEASGADKLPDTLVFDVPVFAQPAVPVRAKIRVAFDLDPQTERFRLIPIPGEVDRAWAAGESFVAWGLAEQIAAVAVPATDDEATGGDTIKLYHGAPE